MASQLRTKDYKRLAAFIVDEQRRREANKKRAELERQWKDVDRQIAMVPKTPQRNDPNDTESSWMPAIESPNQAWALEVLAADVKRLIFPPDQTWYDCSAVFTDKLADVIKKVPILTGDDSGTTLGAVDQRTVDLIAKSTLDHYHALYDFRANWSTLFVEALKYGTYVGRGALVDLSVFSSEFRRASSSKAMTVPVLAPMSIKNFYPDDSTPHLLHESTTVQPMHIRRYWQRIEDMRRAAAVATAEGIGAGWVLKQIDMIDDKKIDPKGVEVLEAEGDFYLPRTVGDDVYLGSHIVTVVVCSGGPFVVRTRERKFPFSSYIVGVYQRDEADTPYGTSPLVKGVPLQELVTEAANRLSAAAILNTEPPVEYLADDTNLIVSGGPIIAPGQKIPVEAINNTRNLQIGDLNGLLALWQGGQKIYEDLTGVNDPRRDGALKSHTTAQASTIGLSRGLLRTENFVDGVNIGPMTSWLYMEYELAKLAMTRAMTVSVQDGPNQGQHFEVTRAMLADDCDFVVYGASGQANHATRVQNTIAAFKVAAESEQLVVQSGGRPTDFDEFRREVYAQLGLRNVDRFFKAAAAGTPGQSALQGAPQGPGGAAAALAGLQTAAE